MICQLKTWLQMSVGVKLIYLMGSDGNYIVLTYSSVNISGCLSESVHITSGVPQGSILGPTLFLLFINDIEDILFRTFVRMKLFADDVKLYSTFAYNLHDLQVVCDRLTVWAEEWQLLIAYNKCISHRLSSHAGAGGNSGYTL